MKNLELCDDHDEYTAYLSIDDLYFNQTRHLILTIEDIENITAFEIDESSAKQIISYLQAFYGK